MIESVDVGRVYVVDVDRYLDRVGLRETLQRLKTAGEISTLSRYLSTSTTYTLCRVSLNPTLEGDSATFGV